MQHCQTPHPSFYSGLECLGFYPILENKITPLLPQSVLIYSPLTNLNRTPGSLGQGLPCVAVFDRNSAEWAAHKGEICTMKTHSKYLEHFLYIWNLQEGCNSAKSMRPSSIAFHLFMRPQEDQSFILDHATRKNIPVSKFIFLRGHIFAYQELMATKPI